MKYQRNTLPRSECPFCEQMTTVVESSEVKTIDTRDGPYIIKDYRSSRCSECKIYFVTGAQIRYNDSIKEPILFYPRLNRSV